MIKKPTFGPLIGHITCDYINIWVCENFDQDDSTNKIYAILILNNEKNYQIQLKHYDNNSGVFHINYLLPNTTYNMKICISDDKLYDPFKIIQSNIFEEINVRTLPNPIFSGTGTIALFSCHYPVPYKKSDKMFKYLKDVLDRSDYNNTPILCHVGDQIYADQLNRFIPIRRADSAREFQELYEKKFSGKYFSSLVREYPSIMILDDHEIEDNWCMDRLKSREVYQNSRDLFTCAISAYKIYQASHGPNCPDINNSKLFYNFNIGVYPFFVLDARTDRYVETGDLLGKNAPDSQLNQLCEWLKLQHNDVPKFIISSCTFVPFTYSDIEDMDNGVGDNWAKFPKTRASLNKFIVDNNIQKVVFLSGDVHNSMALTINLESNGRNLQMYQIVSSALFWDFPFADGDITNYIVDTKKYEGKKPSLFDRIFKRKKKASFKFKDSNNESWKMHYILHENSYTQLNNFAIINFSLDDIDIKWYGENSELLAEHKFIFD